MQSEPKSIPRYNSHIHHCKNTEIQSMASKVATFSVARNHFTGLKRPKSSIAEASSECRFSGESSTNHDICERVDNPDFGETRYNSGEQFENSLSSEPLGSEQTLQRARCAPFPVSMQPKRSAREILSIIGETDPSGENCGRAQSSTCRSTWNDEIGSTNLEFRSPKLPRRTDFIELSSISEDWAPVAPDAKKLRLGNKVSPQSRQLNTWSETVTPSPLLTGFSRASAAENSHDQPQKLRVCSELPKRILHRNTERLCFPTAKECEEQLIRRIVQVPAIFSSWHQYSTTFTSAVYEEINLRVRELALSFYRACQVSCEHDAEFAHICFLEGISHSANDQSLFSTSGYFRCEFSRNASLLL